MAFPKVMVFAGEKVSLVAVRERHEEEVVLMKALQEQGYVAMTFLESPMRPEAPVAVYKGRKVSSGAKRRMWNGAEF